MTGKGGVDENLGIKRLKIARPEWALSTSGRTARLLTHAALPVWGGKANYVYEPKPCGASSSLPPCRVVLLLFPTTSWSHPLPVPGSPGSLALTTAAVPTPTLPSPFCLVISNPGEGEARPVSGAARPERTRLGAPPRPAGGGRRNRLGRIRAVPRTSSSPRRSVSPAPPQDSNCGTRGGEIRAAGGRTCTKAL